MPLKNDIYLSTLVFMGMGMAEIIDEADREDYAIEFSSGLPYLQDAEKVYLEAGIKRLPHNYFPAPKVPFVLNLGSADGEVRRKSVDHCLRGLQLAKKSAAPFFSAHAGFCIDPDPGQLGRKIKYSPTFDVEINFKYFIDSVKTILDQAEKLKIKFLIENNVLAPFNVTPGYASPLLCVDSAGIIEVFEATGHPSLGLLLDTAHLKVSARTLGFKVESELKKIIKLVDAVHHSDNNGELDDNGPLSADYWFLPFLSQLKPMPHVLEVKRLNKNEIQKQISLLRKHGC